MGRMKRIVLTLSLFMFLGVNGINAKNAPKSDAERIAMRVERLDKKLELTEPQEKSIKELLVVSSINSIYPLVSDSRTL